jgi:hypothetical protein
VAVHDVNVNPVAARGIDGTYLLAEFGEVCGKDRAIMMSRFMALSLSARP